MILTESEIESIDAMKQFFKDKGIKIVDAILFGSRARGDNQSDSDYDFLFVTDNEIDSKSKSYLKVELQKELIKHNILLPMDLIIKSLKTFQDEIVLPFNISYSAFNEGIRL